MLNIDNYRLKIGSQNYYFDCSKNREPPPRVPLALFGFQKILADSLGNPRRVALRRSEFWRKRRFYFLAAGLGIEPRFTASKAAVLPLYDPAIINLYMYLLTYGYNFTFVSYYRFAALIGTCCLHTNRNTSWVNRFTTIIRSHNT